MLCSTASEVPGYMSQLVCAMPNEHRLLAAVKTSDAAWDGV